MIQASDLRMQGRTAKFLIRCVVQLASPGAALSIAEAGAAQRTCTWHLPHQRNDCASRCRTCLITVAAQPVAMVAQSLADEAGFLRVSGLETAVHALQATELSAMERSAQHVWPVVSLLSTHVPFAAGQHPPLQ